MVDALRQALRGAEEQNTRMQDPVGWVENDEKDWGADRKETPLKQIYAEMLKVGGEMCVYM